jgi:CBS domain-containing protein
MTVNEPEREPRSDPEPGGLPPAFRSLLGEVLRRRRRDELLGHSRRVAGLAAALAGEGRDPLAIADLVARLGGALVRRLAALHAAEHGPAPAPWALLALGSAGRREQPLPGDQDLALVVADEAGERALGWCRALAGRVEEDLLAAGFPPCPGGLAASRLVRRRAEWCGRVQAAAEEPVPAAVLEVAVLLDGRRVAGRLDLRPLRAALTAGADRPRFLRELVRAALAFRPPRVGLLRRGPRLDLKVQALAPLVLLARCYGLAARSPALGTCARLEAAREAGLLGGDVAGPAAAALRLFTGLRLRLELGAAGAAAGPPELAIAALPGEERRGLAAALRAVRRLQERAASRFGVE